MLVLRTVSARRYRIVGRLPSPYDDDFHRRVHDHRFLMLAAGEERTFGWVTADNCLITRFDVDTVVRGEYAALGLRIDKRRPNPRLIRARLELEIEGRRKAAADAGKPLRLGRDERQQLRADVHAELLRDTSPSVELHTVLLHPKRKVLWMLGLGRQAGEVMVRLVRDTFGVELSPLTPWRRGQEILAGQPAADRLEALSRSEFRAQPGAPRRLFAEDAALEEVR